jgi:hypothetical protein
MKRAFGLALVLGTTVSGNAYAWNFSEHLIIGQIAFQQACAEMKARLGPTPDPARVDRLRLACEGPGSLLPDAASTPASDREIALRLPAYVYGQATAVAGDLLSTPEDFFSAIGGENVLSTGNYLALALVNSSHFTYENVRTWRRHHATALEEAIYAAQWQGSERTTRFEHAFYMEAFSAHFLADAHAAGHMGFNRPASSVAASKVFHDHWNDHGRMVRNRRGNIWTAYGDGRLFSAKNGPNMANVVEAARLSVMSFLTAFVTGNRDSTLDDTVESVLPSATYSYDHPGFLALPMAWAEWLYPRVRQFREFREDMEAATTDQARAEIAAQTKPVPGKPETADQLYLRPTSAVYNRAFKDYGLDAWWLFGGRNYRELGTWQGIVPEFNFRVLTDSLRFFLGVGYIYRPENALAAGFGARYQAGTSYHGLLTHELSYQNWARYKSDVWQTASGWKHLEPRNSSFGLGYRLSVEAASLILSLEVSPALVFEDYKPSFGYMTGFTIEYLLSAAGGGPL